MPAFENVTVKISDLRLDQDNPRLGESQPNQQATAIALAKKIGSKQLLALAKDVVDEGIDPTNRTIVIPTQDQARRYIVLEGNRRLLVLKALETPAILASVMSAAEMRTVEGLSKKYLSSGPLDEIDCVLFRKEEDAAHWIWLRHTGQNDGAGLIPWQNPEQERWKERLGDGNRRMSLGVQALTFADRINGNRITTERISTNVDRVVSNAQCRALMGIELRDKELFALYPADELMKPLRRLIDDLSGKKVKVKDIYDRSDQLDYLKLFSAANLPDPATKLSKAVPLGELRRGRRGGSATKGDAGKRSSAGAKGGTAGPGGGSSQTRQTLATPGSKLNPTAPRINSIYVELLNLDATVYPNGAAVLFRVFLELSVDHYMQIEGVKLPANTRTTLANKLKAAAEHLQTAGRINQQLKRAVDVVAGTQNTSLSASTFTFNQYVHNYYTFAKPTELFSAWDELLPFLAKLS
jgi:hypothetical protein